MYTSQQIYSPCRIFPSAVVARISHMPDREVSHGDNIIPHGVDHYDYDRWEEVVKCSTLRSVDFTYRHCRGKLTKFKPRKKLQKLH